MNQWEMTSAFVWLWAKNFAVLLVAIFAAYKMGRKRRYIWWFAGLGVLGYWLDLVFWDWYGWLVPRQRAGYWLETFLVDQTFTTFYSDVYIFLKPLLSYGVVLWFYHLIRDRRRE